MNINIAIIGLGYVGLPLAIEFGKKIPVIGFDINTKRIGELRCGIDKTNEVEPGEFLQSKKLSFTNNLKDIEKCNFFIVTVPTPIDNQKKPNLSPLFEATKKVGEVLKKGDTVIYESTVYPGCTEEECVPILEKKSGLTLNKDFDVGYSPERINPGDKAHRLVSIKKITSGSNIIAANNIDNLYKKIIYAGTYKAESIKIAEAAKVIENTQRDLNIALINELTIIFNRIGIDTEAVLKAAATKWNFIPFRPGLVGGHCIGVDPYYLTYKAESIGYHPEIILSGRRLNDNMGIYVVNQLIKKMSQKGILINNSKILIMGFTFKENCPDVRNTKVIDIYNELVGFSCVVDVYDPWVNEEEVYSEYGIKILQSLNDNQYDGIILAVGHKQFAEMGIDKIRSYGKSLNIIYDLKYIFNNDDVDIRL